jgi:DNA-binding response OmpR family regulator
MRVLLVDEEAQSAARLTTVLRGNGYTVVRATTGKEALEAPSPDVVLLDIALSDRDGIELCRVLRRRGGSLAIIVVTARADERDLVAGLNAGADDYVVKPFSNPELLARIEAVTRRTSGTKRATRMVSAGPISVDIDAGRVTFRNRQVALTRKETEILTVLVDGCGSVITYERLMLAVWRTSWVGRHTLDVHVGSLRAKLGVPDLVQTVRGVGYRLRTSRLEA